MTRTSLRRRTRLATVGVVGGVGVTAVAAAVTLGPAAFAANPHHPSTGAGARDSASEAAVAPTPTPTPTSTGASSAPHEGAGAARHHRPAASSTTATTTTPSADYGKAKFRVGVQEKDGAYPFDADLAGSTFQIVETGPNAGDGGTKTVTCTAEDITGSVRAHDAGDDTPTYCYSFSDGQETAYQAGMGDTEQVTQLTAVTGLEVDPTVVTVDPCTTDDDGCVDEPDVVFTDPGIPPVARPDHADTQIGTPVDIDVLVNDSTQGAPPTLSIESDPSHGTATVVPAPSPAPSSSTPTDSATATATATDSGTPTTVLATGTPTVFAHSAPRLSSTYVHYVPADGFSGEDTFDYRLTTANGYSITTVTVDIPSPASSSSTSVLPTSTSQSPTSTIAPPASTTTASTSTSSTLVLPTSTSRAPQPVSTDPDLPYTGAPISGFVEAAGGLLVGGVAVRVAAGRRRRAGRRRGGHA